MHGLATRCLVIVGLALAVPLCGCANTTKGDAATCASEGFTAGSPSFNNCVSKLQQRRALLAKINAQEDPVAKLNGNLSGRYNSGCSRVDSRTTCNDPF